MRYDQARWTREGVEGATDLDGTDGAEGEAVYEPLLSEKGAKSVLTDDSPLPEDLTRDELSLPGLAEPEVARHYTRLSQMNYGVESGPVPLGSCTMKYNPKFTEDLAALPSASVHPDRDPETVQGTLELAYRLQDYLARIGGMDAVTLQPPAGAIGEFTGIRIAQAYHEARDDERTEVVIPDSAHGTNFASAAMAGYDVITLPSGKDGRVDLEALAGAVSEATAAMMLTNPNTLGLVERDIEQIAELVHDAGALLYYDGANLNALLGRARPGDMGFDLMHFNLHKTFGTPHGGGGPGAGPVGVTEELTDFLPTPHIRPVGREEQSESSGTIEQTEQTGTSGRTNNVAGGPSSARSTRDFVFFEPERTIGTVHGYHGNWLVLVKAYAYIARLGDEGLGDASTKAVLNANYLAEQIDYDVPFGPFHHEFVASAGDRDAADVAKRMLDYGVHPPTTKWPELVDEAMMTEPTEVESRTSLDQLAAAFNAVREDEDATLAEAPKRTAARRIDQVSAARNPRLSWRPLDE